MAFGGYSSAAQPMPWLQNMQATVGGVGALAELVGMTAEAAKHFGSSWLLLLESAGQTAGEVAGVLDPRPPVDPASGVPSCSAEDHLRAQRARAARWLVGAALVAALALAGRAAAKQVSSPTGRGLRVAALVAVGAAVGFSRPDWVEERARRVARYALRLLDSAEGAVADVAGSGAAAAPDRGLLQGDSAAAAAGEGEARDAFGPADGPVATQHMAAAAGTAEAAAPAARRGLGEEAAGPSGGGAASPLPAGALAASAGSVPSGEEVRRRRLAALAGRLQG